MYTQENIDQIKHYIKTRGYATNYAEPTWHLVTTLLLMFGLLYAIHITKGYSPGLILLLALIMMRLFMMFHDMCHRSFFPTDERAKNEKGFNFQIAALIEQWCLFSASYWNNTHSKHHGALGNLNEYDQTRSVLISSEYDKLPEYQKVLYQFIRFPPVFFLLAPIEIYWIERFIQGEWMYLTKYVLWLVILYKLGNWKLLLSYVAAQYLGGVLGLMMFHLQHQVNDGFWKRFDNKDPVLRANADLSGSTVLTIPWFLEYFSNGIEYHNIHHIDPGIPSYNMKRTYYGLVNRGLLKEDKVDYATEWTSLWNTLYDEKTEKYI
jgi:acyl-lipid omega-6 desaturase (Delta-12 desaturase)